MLAIVNAPVPHLSIVGFCLEGTEEGIEAKPADRTTDLARLG